MIEWKGDALEKMENLKTLIIKDGHFSRGPKHLPNSLRVLEWPRYPSQYIPSDFCPENLSICNLPGIDLISLKKTSGTSAPNIVQKTAWWNCCGLI